MDNEWWSLKNCFCPLEIAIRFQYAFLELFGLAYLWKFTNDMTNKANVFQLNSVSNALQTPHGSILKRYQIIFCIVIRTKSRAVARKNLLCSKDKEADFCHLNQFNRSNSCNFIHIASSKPDFFTRYSQYAQTSIFIRFIIRKMWRI